MHVSGFDTHTNQRSGISEASVPRILHTSVPGQLSKQAWQLNTSHYPHRLSSPILTLGYLPSPADLNTSSDQGT